MIRACLSAGLQVKNVQVETQQGHSITFMGRTFNFHSDSLHPRYKWILANSEGKLTKAFMRVACIKTLNLLFSPKLFCYE